MALFRKRKPRGDLIPRDALSQLASVGRTAYLEGGYFAAAPEFIAPSLRAFGGASPGTPEWTSFETQFFRELAQAANDQGEWAIAGAFRVAFELGGGGENQDFRTLVDSAAMFLREAGVPRQGLPPVILERWWSWYDGPDPRPPQ